MVNNVEPAVAAVPTLSTPSLGKLSRLLPVALMVVALAALNVGLNTRLAPKTKDKPAPASAPATERKPDAQNTQPAPATQPAASSDATSLLNASAGVGGNAPWVVLAGEWAYDNNTITQTNADGDDRIIAYRASQFSNGVFRARMTMQQGRGGGVIVGMRDPLSKNGATLIRYTDDGKGVFWGTFNDEGKFTGLGFAPAPDPAQDAHVMEVQLGKTLTLSLDGRVLAKDIRVSVEQGHVGLVASRAVARFDQVVMVKDGKLQDAAAPLANEPAIETAAAPATLEQGGVSLESLSGKWEQAGTLIRQTDAALADFLVGTGMMAEQYTLSAKLSFKSEAAGGGFVFHMPKRDSKNGAYLVRFGKGGREVFWGRFDDAGKFAGQGDVQLKTDTAAPHSLTVIVSKGSYDVYVDGKRVAESMPLQGEQGWIGLTSFSGETTFDGFRLQPGKVIP